MKNRAFTLIELLVVIAIIAILAAILFPVFAQARAKARQIACLSNQKQIGTAFMMYIQDYDETFPFSDYGVSNNAADYIVWPFLVEPYIKGGVQGTTNKNQKKSVFVCPDNGVSTPDSFFTGFAAARGLLNYNVNRYLMEANRNNQGINNGLTVQSLAAVEAPASLVMMCEAVGTLPEIQGRDNRYTTASDQHNAGYMNARQRHSGGANFTFADGHSKWFKAPQNYQARSVNGVIWTKCDGPLGANGAGWFQPLSGTLPVTNSACQ
ncbi:MAG: DUF1559 domain-containing protein [Armatimonadetes bacterium]|nr:DUF1559 domain-containing protein [Armatimonadota bacterium]